MPEYFYADRLFNALERVEPEPGMLLVSAPGMFSPEFARTVLLVLEHDVDHTLGVVLNRVKALGKAVPYIALLGWCLVSLVRNRHHLFWVFFPLVVTVALLLATTPQLDPRFRVPMVPLLLAIALMSCPSIEESTQ